MFFFTSVTGGDEKRVGYYAGLMVRLGLTSIAPRETWKVIAIFFIITPECYSSIIIPGDCHVLDSNVGPHWKETDTITWNADSGDLQYVFWTFTDFLGVGCQV